MSVVRMSIAAVALMLTAAQVEAQGARPQQPMMRDSSAMPLCPAPAMRDTAMAPRSGMMRDTAMAPRSGMMRDTAMVARGAAMRAPADSVKAPCRPSPMRDGMRRPS